MDHKTVERLAETLRSKGQEQRFLTLSLRHLPPDVIEELRESACSYPNADQHDDNGCFFVWADRLYSEDQIESVYLIGQLAAEMGCAYVFFDPGAYHTPGLEVFENSR